MLNKKKIGILGGLGPESTAVFYYNLVQRIQQEFHLCSTKDYPQIIINSISIADLVEENISDSDLQTIIAGLNQLDKFNPDFTAIVCNSTYAKFDLLQSKSLTRILDLKSIVKIYIDTIGVENIGILGTSISVSTLYNFPEKQVFLANTTQQQVIDKLIKDFNKGRLATNYFDLLNDIVDNLLGKGAELVLLACTELGLIGNKMGNTIDPMKLMIDKIILELQN